MGPWNRSNSKPRNTGGTFHRGTGWGIWWSLCLPQMPRSPVFVSLRFIPHMTTWLSLSWEHEMCRWAQTAIHRDSNISTQQPCASVPQHTLHAMPDWVRLRQPLSSEKYRHSQKVTAFFKAHGFYLDFSMVFGLWSNTHQQAGGFPAPKHRSATCGHGCCGLNLRICLGGRK